MYPTHFTKPEVRNMYMYLCVHLVWIIRRVENEESSIQSFYLNNLRHVEMVIAKDKRYMHLFFITVLVFYEDVLCSCYGEVGGVTLYHVISIPF